MRRNKLTHRETEVLQLVVGEFSSIEIADKLSISIRTVDSHRKNIIKKTNCNNLIALTKYAIKEGLIENYYYKNNIYEKNFTLSN